MKLTILSAVTFALLLSSCANDNQTFAINGFYPIVVGTDGCEKPMSTGTAKAYLANGSLDVAAGDAQFIVGASVETTGTPIPSKTVLFPDGTVAVPAPNDRPIITEYVVTYTLSKRLGQPTLKPFVVPYRIDLSVGSINLADTTVQLISSELSSALFDGLTPIDPSSGEVDSVDIGCALEFRGEFSASRAPFTTGKASFNVRAYRSTPSIASCPAGKRYPRFIDSSRTVNFCTFAGQSSGAGQPLPPSICCDPSTDVGC